MGIQHTTKESTRFLLTADCYLPKFGGYKHKGDIVVVPEGTPIQSVWTEVDENNEPVAGGHRARRISRHITRPKGDEDKSLAEIADKGAAADVDAAEPDEEPSSAAPTPPSVPAAAAKPKAAATTKKPAAAAKPKRS